jgi:hypothetical protein
VEASESSKAKKLGLALQAIEKYGFAEGKIWILLPSALISFLPIWIFLPLALNIFT